MDAILISFESLSCAFPRAEAVLAAARVHVLAGVRVVVRHVGTQSTHCKISRTWPTKYRYTFEPFNSRAVSFLELYS